MVGQGHHGAGALGAIWRGKPAGAVDAPAQAGLRFQGRLYVFLHPQPLRVDNADGGDGFGELRQPFVKLLVQLGRGAFPLAFHQNQLAAAQLDAHVGGAFYAAPLRFGVQSMPAQFLRQQRVHHFLAGRSPPSAPGGHRLHYTNGAHDGVSYAKPLWRGGAVMVEQAERLWTFDAVEPGQYGAETVVAITAENIAGYAEVALNGDARYRGPGATLAMPTMVLAYAPLLREEIAEANRFVAQEQSKTARRQTPFAKCEIRWRHPVCAGDVITGRRGVRGEVRAAGQPVRHLPRQRRQPARRNGGGVRLHLHLRLRRGPAGRFQGDAPTLTLSLRRQFPLPPGEG